MIKLSPQPRAYGIKTACVLCGLGRTKLYQEIAAGRLKTKKIGRRTLIDADDFQAWLDSYPTVHRPVMGAFHG